MFAKSGLKIGFLRFIKVYIAHKFSLGVIDTNNF